MANATSRSLHNHEFSSKALGIENLSDSEVEHNAVNPSKLPEQVAAKIRAQENVIVTGRMVREVRKTIKPQEATDDLLKVLAFFSEKAIDIKVCSFLHLLPMLVFQDKKLILRILEQISDASEHAAFTCSLISHKIFFKHEQIMLRISRCSETLLIDTTHVRESLESC